MLILLSPTKIQNFDPQDFVSEHSLPIYGNEAKSLADILRQLSLSELAEILEVNTNLAQLNVDRYFNWDQALTPPNGKQAVFVFNGEAFKTLDAKRFNAEEMNYLQSNLRILSGLYGILRPFDVIQPYRLDVSTALKTEAGSTLYHFWGNKITEAINEAIKHTKNSEFILNLTSKEYTKSINKKILNAKIVDIEFLEYKNDRFKPIVIYIKKARGLMARYVIENRIETFDELKGFNGGGYWFNEALSNDSKLVFIR